MNDSAIMLFPSMLYNGKVLHPKEKQMEISALENLPVKHLSPSAIRSYLADRQGFFRRYIRLEFDSSSSPSLVEGEAYHKALELFWNDKMNGVSEKWSEYENAAMAIIAERDEEGCVEWGKTGSAEKSMQTVKTALSFYRSELPSYNPIGVEKKIVAGFRDQNGVEMPVPLKTISDLISGDADEIDIADHKLVTTFAEEDQPQPAFEIQAAANFFTVLAEHGRPPRRMIFDQVKKSKNSDGSPQRREYVIEFMDNLGNPHPCLKRFAEIYRRILCELSGMPLIDFETQTMRFLPNPYAQFGWKESWQDFCDEVDDGKEWNREEISIIQSNRYANIDEETADF